MAYKITHVVKVYKINKCVVVKFQSNVVKFKFEFLIRTLQDSEMRKKKNKAKQTIKYGVEKGPALLLQRCQ